MPAAQGAHTMLAGATTGSEATSGHDELPATEVIPAAHAAHALAPALAEKVPGAHGVHAVLSPRPYVPDAHAVHPADVALGTQYVPAQQHTVEPEVVHWGYVTPEVQPEVGQVAGPVPAYRYHSAMLVYP